MQFFTKVFSLSYDMSFTHYSRFPKVLERRELVILAILCAVVASISPLANGQAHAAPTLSYSCSSTHCYGANYWGSATGADTRISLHQATPGNGFEDNELWMPSSDRQYWVEAGVTADTHFKGGGTAFFWADKRPNGGGYAEHYSSLLTTSDWSQPNALARITRNGSSQWNVSVSDGVTSLTGTSTNNNFNVGNIIIGLELYGTSGAYVPGNDLTNNRYQTNGNFVYQPNYGDSTFITGPVTAYWAVPPPNSSTGGDWHTCLHGSGC